MSSVKGARRIKRVGDLIAVCGGFIGLVVWLGVFSGDLSHNSVLLFILPMGAGAAISGLGMILERSAKSA
jgi:hypothetical protein